MFKLDNYVALYGFLRAITLIANCFTLWLCLKYILPTLKIGAEVDWHLVFLLVLCVGVTYIFFMSFMKFYRRFTLESFMCLVIDSSFKEIPQLPHSYIMSSNIDAQQNLTHERNNNYSFTNENIGSSTNTTMIQSEGSEIADTNTNITEDVS